METGNRAKSKLAEEKTRSCPACSRTVASQPVDRHLDRVSGIEYRLFACPHCAVVFTWPAKAVGADWYAKAVPLEPTIAPEQDWRFEMFLRDNPGPERLLDVGCGSGEFILWARSKGYSSCVGFDYDERKTEQARALGVEAHTEDWEAFCRSWKDEEFGVITIFDVLEHVPQPRALLREVRRLVKPNGKVVITLPNALRPMPFGREDYDFPPHHFTRWSPEAMRSFLGSEGFSVIHQDASMLGISYFLDVMVTHCAVKPAISLAKKALFRGQAQLGTTVSELFDGAAAPSGSNGPRRGALSNKQLRSLLFASYRSLCKILFWPFAAAMVLYYRATRADCGQCLYTLARNNGRA